MKKEDGNKKESPNKASPIVIKTIQGLLFVLCIVIPIIINHLCEKYNTVWCACTIAFLMIPYSIMAFRQEAERSHKFTAEQKEFNKKKSVYMVLYLWYMDFVALCIFQKWLIMSLLFGIIALIIVFYNIGVIFINKRGNNKTIDIGIILDFIFGIVLTIYLIFIIPNDGLRSVVIPIVAAVYGGLITLVGVVLTIKNSEKNLTLNNRMRNKPLLIMENNNYTFDILESDHKFANISENAAEKMGLGFIMKNISSMPCRVVGVRYMGRSIDCDDKHVWVESQKLIWFRISFAFKEENYEMTLVVEDISGFEYEYSLNFDLSGNITSIIDIYAKNGGISNA